MNDISELNHSIDSYDSPRKGGARSTLDNMDPKTKKKLFGNLTIADVALEGCKDELMTT